MNKLILMIREQGYALTRLAADPGVAKVAWRLTKPTGETYDVRLDNRGVHCDCADFTFRHANAPDGCKHVQALTEFGLI